MDMGWAECMRTPREDDHVKLGADTRVALPHAWEPLGYRKLGESRQDPSLPEVPHAVHMLGQWWRWGFGR